ncbi:hypothetical protein V6N13_000565 [Hibiscus sabdariffa]
MPENRLQFCRNRKRSHLLLTWIEEFLLFISLSSTGVKQFEHAMTVSEEMSGKTMQGKQDDYRINNLRVNQNIGFQIFFSLL